MGAHVDGNRPWAGAREIKTANSGATGCANCARLLPSLGWVLAWLGAGRRAAVAHAKSVRRDDSGRRGEPELLRYDRKTARERDYRAWVGTQLYERGVLPAEPGDPEAREAWWAAVARHARGRGGWRRKFEAWRRKVEAWRYRNWPFEEDEQPSYGLVGIRGRPPLLVLLGGGDLQAVLNGTIDAVNQFGHHLHALIHAQGVTVKCSRGHYGRHGRCPSCGKCRWCSDMPSMLWRMSSL